MVSYNKASALLSILFPAISTGSASANKTPNPNKDLDLLKSRESKHHYKNLHANSGVGHDRLHASLRDDLKTLESEECVPLVSELEGFLMEILESTDEEFIDYACNSIQLKETLAKLDAMKHDMVEQKDPCIKAAEEFDINAIKKSDLASKDACAVKVQSLLDVARDAQDFADVRVGATIATWLAVAFALGGIYSTYLPDESEALLQKSL